MPVSYIEFAPAARDFPIVFASSDQGKSYAAVAVLGLAQNENLFVRNGAWEQGVYVPAYVRRYPFCMARVTMGNTAQENRLICVEKSYVSESGEKMFDAEGKPTQRWTQIEQLLREYEADSSAPRLCDPRRLRSLRAVHHAGDARDRRRADQPRGGCSAYRSRSSST
jgi:hypothetical protein